METHAALAEMADQVARQLVAEALGRLTRADIVVTVHATPAPKLLAAAKPAKRPKPTKSAPVRRGWSAAHRAAFAAAMARKRKRTTVGAAPALCGRCDHPAEKHPGGGACLSKGCICEALHR